MKRTDKLLVAVTAIAGTLCAAYCLLLFVPFYHTEEKGLSPRTKLMERYRIRFSPLIIGSDLLLEEQTLLLDSRTIWSSRINNGRPFGRNFHVSPDGKFVAFEDWLRNGPIVTLNMETGQQKLLAAPREVDDTTHYYGYPFVIKGWSDDSANLIVEVSGPFPEFGAAGATKECQETWVIHRETGVATRKTK